MANNPNMADLVYISGTGGSFSVNASDYVVYQTIKADGSKQLWLNINGVTVLYNGFGPQNIYDNGANPDVSISGEGLVGGVKANDVKEDSSLVNVGPNAPYYGISQHRASHQIWFPHETTIQVAGTHKNVIQYVYADGTPVLGADGKPLTVTQEINMTRNLTLDLDQSSLDSIAEYAQTHTADETLEFIKSTYKVTKDSGWQMTDANGNVVTSPYASVASPTEKGYTAVVKSTNAPGVSAGANGSKAQAQFEMPATDAVVQNGMLTDDYKNNGTTGIPDDYNTVVEYVKDDYQDQGIQKVTVGEDVSRDVDYKENTNNSTDFTDGLNGDANQRNEAAGLPNMNVPAGTQTKQTVHLTGTGYLNKNTGQFVKVDANGHAVDSQGRLITYDQAGNVVVGQLDASGKVVPLLTNGQTTATSFVQGSLVWTVGQPADGWNAPDVNDYSHVPGTVPALDNNTMVTMDGQQMTLKDLLATLNGNAQTQNAVAADTITDAANYPRMSQVVPSSQYIFDQFQAVDANGANLPYVVTLTVDRNNPTGGVYMYVTDPSYQTIYWSSMRDNGGKAIAVNGTAPAYYYNVLPNGQRFQINVENFGGDYGNSVSVWGNNVQLRHIFGYGAVDTSVTASAWGDFKPHQVTQTIKYVDQNNANQDIINEVKVTGLTGQQFNAKGTNDAKIPGYTLTNNDATTGTVSDYQVGHTYVRTWYDPATNSTITEHFTLKNAQGDMDVVVTVNGQQVTGQAEKTGSTTTVGANDFYDVHIGNLTYGIQNPFVPSTDTVTLEYTQDQATTDPYYVVYTQQGSLTVVFHDDKTNQDLKTVKTGMEDNGTKVTYTTTDDLKTLENEGYVYVKTDGEMPATIEGGKTPTVTIHLTHGVQPVTPGTPTDQVPNNTPKDAQPDQLTKQVTETVTYVNADGTVFTGTVPANAKQTVTFTGTAYVDKVTGELVNAKQVDRNWVVDTDNPATPAITWTAENGKNSFDAVTSPAETGYHVASVSDHANGNNVAAINGLTQDSGDVTITVTYAANGQKLVNEKDAPASQTVRYVDEQGNALIPDAKQSQDFHYSGDTVDATTGDQIKAGSWDASSHTFTAENVPVIPGYVAVSGYTVNGDGTITAGGFTANATDSDHARNQTFTVTYHKVGNIVPVLPGGKTPVPGSTPQQYPNDPDNPTKVTPNEKVPYIPGYTPSVPTVTPGDPTVDTPVVYTANDQTVLVKYVDDKGTDLSSYNKTITGKPGTALDYTTKSTIDELKAKGYVLVSDNFDVTTMPKDGGTYEVHLTHGLVPVGPNTPTDQNHGVDPSQVKKDVTETVHYVGAGANTPKDNVQASEWGRTVTVDAVTNQIVDGKYTTDWSIIPGQKTSYDAVSTPVVDGYHADRAQVAGTAVTQDNIYEEVTYSPNGKIVPQDPNGNPIPNVPTPQYPTDPHDPTGVTPNEPVPVIPGWTPSTPTVTPKDPGKDTPVTYVQQGSVTVTFHDDTTDTDIPEVGYDSHAQDDKTAISYTTDQDLQKLEDEGYVYVKTDGTLPTAIIGGKTVTVTVHVKHGTETLTPDKPGTPDTPINPKDPTGPKYPAGTDKDSLEVTGKQIIHYVGAGANTPKDDVEDYTFTKSVTIDKVTGKIIDKGQWSDTSHTFGTKDTPVVDGYHADKRYAGGETITPDDLNKTVTVTYSPNGRIIPVDPNGNPIPNVPTPQYPTDPHDPTGVKPNEPVPHIDGYTPSTETVTPKDPGKDTPVVYTPEKPKGSETPVAQGSVTVVFHDDTTDTDLPGVGYVSGQKDDQTKVDYTAVADLTKLENQGYEYVSTDGTLPSVIEGKQDITVTIHVKHGTQPINPDQPGTPGTPINPNDPTGPKYPDGTDKASLDKTVTRTVQYVDGDGNVLATAVEQPVTFTASGELDKVTGEWTKPLTWTADQALAGVRIPTVDGYHVISIDKDANGLTSVKGVTLSHSDSDYTVTVTYAKDSAPVTPTVPENTVVTGKQTVHYVYQNGKELKPTATTGNVTFTKDGTTGKWDQDSHTYGNVTAPVIPDYVVNVSTVGGKTVTPDDPDQDITFTYTPVGKITPVDPGGNPIPGAPTPKYPNDPNDPTGVTPNEPVPDIPGYTPVTPTVTPDNPTVDTPVTYVPKETPKTPETPQTPATPKAPEAPRTPAQPAAPATPTAAPVAPRAITPAAAPKAAAKKLPQTGNQDDSRLATLGLAALSMVGLSAGLLGGKRRKHQD